MKICPSCDSDAIAFDMAEDCTLVPLCLACGARGTAVDSDPGVPSNPLAMAQPVGKPTAKSVAAAPATAATKRAVTEPLNVLGAAKARVRELDREIKRLEKLKTERDQLKRLLAAANQKTGAVVPLRKHA